MTTTQIKRAQAIALKMTGLEHDIAVMKSGSRLITEEPLTVFRHLISKLWRTSRSIALANAMEKLHNLKRELRRIVAMHDALPPSA